MENNFVGNLFSAASTEKEYVSVSCPNCGNKLEVSRGDSTVKCFCCDSAFSRESLMNKAGGGSSTAANVSGMAFSASVAQLIDSPDAGLVYIQNRFDNTNWDDYNENLEIIIPEIEEMVEKSKIKYGATASAWLLDFESVAYPLCKKLEGLRSMAEKMAENYSDIDLTSILDSFDLYKDITANICDCKEAIIKRLENDVAYAEKFALEATALADMKSKLDTIKNTLNAMDVVKTPTDIPELKEARAKLDEIKVRDFASKGIVVGDVYASACQMCEDPYADKNELLRTLQSIRGYSDVNERIFALNRYYNFNGEYYSFCGKSFIFKSRQKISLFDPKEQAKKNKAIIKKEEEYKAEDEYSGTIYSLYEVIDKRPAKEPIVENITRILTVYANRLYYIKFDASICYFDINRRVEVVLDSGRVGDYNCDRIYLSKDGTEFFIRKKLPLEIDKAGCISKILLSKKDEAIERKNNYSVIKVSLVVDSVLTAIKELVDVTEFYGENMFYTKAEEDAKVEEPKKFKLPFGKAPAPETEEKEEEEIKTTFRVYNICTGEDKELLNDGCEIHTVIGDNHIVFSRYAPSAYNKDLFVYNIEKDTETLIENNVLDYTRTIKGRIYYTVGNDDYCPLFSNNLEGTDRVEVMSNDINIVAVRAGWMYAIKGYGRNAVLIKISSDGKNRMVVCTQFDRAIKITDSYIYYIDTANSLRVARTDGKENILIANNISANSVIVDKECIYYLREEDIDNYSTASSLYSMDLSGHNVRKILFNVSNIDNFDDNTIMISRKENALFEIYIPIDKKNNTRTEKKRYNLKHFCKYNKTTGAIETLLTLGLPDEDEYGFKGCFGFGKETKLNSTYKQIPEPKVFKRRNIAKAGSVLDAQANEQGINIKNAAANGCSNAKGCSPTK